MLEILRMHTSSSAARKLYHAAVLENNRKICSPNISIKWFYSSSSYSQINGFTLKWCYYANLKEAQPSVQPSVQLAAS